MKDKIVLPKPGQTSEICLKISSLHCNLLIDFLIKEKVAFSIIPYIEESEFCFRKEELPVSSKQPLSNTEQLLENVYLNYILKNSAASPAIEEIAKEIGWTPSLFKTRFKAYYGKPFYQAYMEQKMKYAAELLNEGLTAAEVSEKIGYSQPIKFNKMFQKHFGITPKKYQSNYRGSAL